MVIIQAGARRDAHLCFVRCPRHGLKLTRADGRCRGIGCDLYAVDPWRQLRGFPIAKWKPIKHRAYRSFVRETLRMVARGAVDADDAILWPTKHHLLTAYDVA
jgi:hypothetical protein